MSRTWKSFYKRRSIDPFHYVTANGLRTREEMVQKLASIGVLPPSDEELNVLFPPPPPPEKPKETPRVKETQEKQDRITARGKPGPGVGDAPDPAGAEPGVDPSPPASGPD